MAQFRKDTNQYLNDGKTIFETVMLADQYGDIVGAANPSGMAVDALMRAVTFCRGSLRPAIDRVVRRRGRPNLQRATEVSKHA